MCQKQLQMIFSFGKSHIILLMLKVKSQQDEVKHSIQEIRKRNRKRIREQELHAFFSVVRAKLIEQAQHQKAEVARIEPQGPPAQQQPYPPNYYEYMQYAMRMLPGQNYPVYHHIPSVPSSLPIVLPQIEQNIYFQKHGFVIYKTLLGCGTYAQVWEGKVKATGQKIAAKEVKVLEENQRKCLKQLESQYVVKVIDIFTHMSKNFIILEFCDKNLRQQLKECNFKIEKALKFFEQLVLGMDVLQSKNIIHRDLKFENILVKDSKIKIADFGLAKCLGSELQVESRRCGTPYTMAPEIYFSLARITSYTIKSDIWSIGVILHEMLYRIHPFDGSAQNFKKQKRARVIRRYGILDKIIDQCLVFEPSLRINWSEFKTLFNYYLEQKYYYLCAKERPLVSRPVSNPPKTVYHHNNIKPQETKVKLIQKQKQRSKDKIKERQESKDRRQGRTPQKRKKISCEKNIVDRDKFENINEKQKSRFQDSKLNNGMKLQIGNKIQKKVFEDNIEKKVHLVDFREVEQRPFQSQFNLILNEKEVRERERQYRTRQLFQALAILLVIFAMLYISFD